MSQLHRCLLASASWLLACGGALQTGAEPQTVRTAGSNLNGSNLNGSNLNGSNLNGSNLNGSELANLLAWVRFSGARLGPVELNGAALEGSQLVAYRGGQRLSGTQLLDARFEGRSGDAAEVPLKITGVIPPAWDGDVWRYRFAYQGVDHLWFPVCTEERSAVAVAGRWDYRYGTPGAGGKVADPAVFTLGCPGAAVDKCVGMGYRPWARTSSGLSLDRHHQACVRMIRADYCGDGISQTTEGRLINVHDAVGIQHDDYDWILEAEWDPAGARCVSAINRSLLGVLCSDRLLDLTCGASWSFSAGALLISETPWGPLEGLL